MLGEDIPRREDAGLVTGATAFLADLVVDDALHAVFVRSPLAHGQIRRIDPAAARAAPGVHAVVTGAELELSPLPAPGGEAGLARPCLADERVRYVGEPVAVVLAQTVEEAVDAAELVDVDYEPLPPVVGPLAALEADAPVLFPVHGSNVVADEADDPLDFAASDVVVRARFHNQRVAPVPLEPNGCVAVPAPDGGVTLWASTQAPFGVRRAVARALECAESAVRVRTAAVGGGFGAKGGVYPEQVVLAALARRVRRAIRWHETRSENLVAMTHGRGQIQEVALGADREGTLTGLDARIVVDVGAYPARGWLIPDNTRLVAAQSYALPRLSFRSTTAVTTTPPTGPYRGAGRPEAATLVERALDMLAAELGIDPIALRRRNLVAADAFPHTTPTGASYDSGDYAHALDEAVRLSGYEELRAAQAHRRTTGARQLLGIGVACYVEASGRGSEYGAVHVEEDGSITAVSGSSAHGQGHETAFAQVVASALEVPYERVQVVQSDTAVVPRGVGTFGSRSLQLSGSAILRAAEQVRERAHHLAADLLEADPGDIVVLEDGRLGVIGSPETAHGWGELARAAADRGEPLAAEEDVEQVGTFPFGTHVAVVEVDRETGLTRLIRHVAVDDCGRVLNPALVDGQVHGGIAQGVGQALFEEVVFDELGTPQSTLVDYHIPAASDLPPFETARTETPTPRNPLGAKGIGESGTTGALAATWNAVVDALAPFGIRHLDPPFTPKRVWQAITGR